MLLSWMDGVVLYECKKSIIIIIIIMFIFIFHYESPFFFFFFLFSEKLCFGPEPFVPHVLYAHIRLASIIFFLIVVGSKPI